MLYRLSTRHTIDRVESLGEDFIGRETRTRSCPIENRTHAGVLGFAVIVVLAPTPQGFTHDLAGGGVLAALDGSPETGDHLFGHGDGDAF